MKNDLINKIANKTNVIEKVGLAHCAVSFLVDALTLHYYQAELLLHSLLQNTSVKKENIVVHCTNRVDQDFLNFLKSQEINYKIVTPYLDEKYCNKLTQLDSFIDNARQYDGVILLDADMFFLEDPFIKDKRSISGKIVDAPNPPLKTLGCIYKEADLALPVSLETDWKSDNNLTISTNFNGGFYYIPSKNIQQINRLWKKWAEWLYARPELFENFSQTIHTDQVSMSMAIQESDINTNVLSSNDNYPIHRNQTLRLFNEKRNVAILHYHREINDFGLISDKKVSHPMIKNAIDKANKSIGKLGESIFYERYLLSLIEFPKQPNNFEDIEQKLQNICSHVQKKTKLILHAGTPKTGTTSLQFYLNDNREVLKEKGILYPMYNILLHAPKHQWFITCLKDGNYTLFLENLENTLKEVDNNTHTVIFSTEGIFNHWMDFDDKAKYFLSLLPKYFDFKLWIWFRNPYTFAKSFYKQNLKNPQISNVSCYGKDLSLDEMLKDEWFLKHFNYLSFIKETESIFGEKKIQIFSFGENVIDQVNKELDIVREFEPYKYKNIGLHEVSEEVLRIINRYPLSSGEKEQAVQYISKLDSLLTPYLKEDKKDEKIDFFKNLLSRQLPILEKKYALSWKDFQKD